MASISNLKVIVATDAKQAVTGFAEVKHAAEDAAKGGASAFDKSTSKVGGAFSKLGNSLSNWGLPFGKSISDIGTKLDNVEGKGQKFSGIMSDIGKVSLQAGAVGLAGAAYESIKLGMNFQSAMTQVVTGAGESQSAIAKVSQGVLDMAATVGQGPQVLATALYTIESAGFHGAAGLDILKASAEGAATGNAQLGTVADATTSIMNAYGGSAGNATAIVNQLIATEKTGKSHLEDIAGALSAVIPIAAAAGLSYAQVGGALSTMTAMGMSAQQGTQDLANTIRSLQNPNAVAVNEMQQLGINSNQVSKNLGKNGLTGTLSYLSGVILKNMGPSGEVMLKAFNQSKAAGQDLQIMLGSMSPTMKNLANEFMSGKVNMSAFRKAMPTNEQGVIGQFTALYAKSKGFNSQLKAGLPAAQTYEAALSKMTGGATGLNTSLMLTGSHAATFQANVDAIGKAAKGSGGKVDGFALTQKNLKFQIDQAKAGAQALADKFGLVLIPWIEKGIKVVSSIVTWFGKHKAAASALAAVVGVVLGGAIATYVLNLGMAAAKSAINFGKMIASALGWGASQEATNTAVQASTEETAAVAETSAASTEIAMGPIGIAIAVIGVAAMLLASHWKTIWKDIKSIASSVWNGGLKGVFESIKGGINKVWSVMKTAWDGIDQVINFVGKHIVQIIKIVLIMGLGPLGVAIDILWTHWKGVWGFIKKAVDDAWKFIQPIFNAVVNTGIALVKGAINDLKSAWDTVWSSIKSVASSAWKWLDTNVIQPIAKIIGPFLKTRLDNLKKNWKTVWDGIKSAVKSVWDFIKPIFDKITSAISTITKGIASVTKVAGKIVGGVGKFLGVSGAAAEGADVRAGSTWLVGEKGPEIFTPSMSGVITPNNQIGPILSPAAPSAIGAGSPTGASGGAGNVIHLTYAPQISVVPMIGTQVAKQLEDALNTHDQTLLQQLNAHVA